MTLKEIEGRIVEIRRTAADGDNEAAHSREDDLHQEVLQYMAETAPAELGEMARLALTTSEIKFDRWYA